MCAKHVNVSCSFFGVALVMLQCMCRKWARATMRVCFCGQWPVTLLLLWRQNLIGGNRFDGDACVLVRADL